MWLSGESVHCPGVDSGTTVQAARQHLREKHPLSEHLTYNFVHGDRILQANEELKMHHVYTVVIAQIFDSTKEEWTLLDLGTAALTSIAVLTGDRVACGFDTGDIIVRDRQGRVQRTFQASQAPHVLTALPHSCLASASKNVITIWDVLEGQLKQKLGGHHQSVKALVVVSEGRELASTSGKYILLWSLVDYRRTAVLRGNTSTVSCLTVLPNNGLVSGNDLGYILYWDLGTHQCMASFHPSAWPVDCMQALPGGSLAIADLSRASILDPVRQTQVCT